METRILTESDAAAWWRIRLESLQKEPFAFGRAPEEHTPIAVETIAQRFRGASQDYFALGAFESDALVGAATFMRETGLKESHKARIFGVYVTASERGKGTGRALIAAILEQARRNPALEQILLAVATCQEPARQLYRSFGFETYGTEPRALKVGDRYLDEDRMILRLQ